MGPVARFYVSNGEPRVEVTDGVASIDVAWEDWELLINQTGVAFTHWALVHDAEYKGWLNRMMRLDGSRPKPRWRWLRRR